MPWCTLVHWLSVFYTLVHWLRPWCTDFKCLLYLGALIKCPLCLGALILSVFYTLVHWLSVFYTLVHWLSVFYTLVHWLTLWPRRCAYVIIESREGCDVRLTVRWLMPRGELYSYLQRWRRYFVAWEREVKDICLVFRRYFVWSKSGARCTKWDLRPPDFTSCSTTAQPLPLLHSTFK